MPQCLDGVDSDVLCCSYLQNSCSGAISSLAPEPYVAFSRLQYLKTLMLEGLEIFSLCLQRCITKCGLTHSFCLPKTSLWSGTWGFSVVASCSGQFTRGHTEALSLVLSWSYSVLAFVYLNHIRWAVDPKELNKDMLLWMLSLAVPAQLLLFLCHDEFFFLLPSLLVELLGVESHWCFTWMTQV